MTLSRPKLGEVLLRKGRVTQGDIDRALETSAKTRRRIGETLIELEVITDADVAQALAEQLGLPYLDLEHTYMIDADMLSLMPFEKMRRFCVLPIGRAGTKIRVVMEDPVNVVLIDDLRFLLGSEIDVFVGARGQIRKHIDKLPQNV
jgi:type IV pilus assembly protein PilB